MNPTRLRMRPLDAVLILALSMMCVITSYKLKIDHSAELVRHMRDTLQGHPWLSEFQNRLLAPWMLSGLSTLTGHRVPDIEIYKIVRVLSAVFALSTVYTCTLRRTRSYSKALLAIGLCCYGYLWTALTFFMEYPEDLFDIGFVYLMCWLCVENLVGWLFPVMLFACLNRESGVFGGLIYACVNTEVRSRFKPAWRRVALGLAMTALAFVFINGVRYAYAGHLTHQTLGIVESVVRWRWALQPFGWLTCWFGMFIPLATLLFAARHSLPQVSVRIMLAAAVILVPTLIVGIVNEIRVFLPFYVLLVFALVESNVDLQFVTAPAATLPADRLRPEER